MVVVDQQQVVLVIDAEQPCADQIAGGEIKRCGVLLLQPLLDDGIRVAISESFWFEVEGSRGVDELHDLAPLKTEGCAQGGMALDQVGQGEAESVEVEVAAEAPQGREVIGGEIRLELVEKPEAGLGVGSGEGLAALGPVAWNRLGGGDSCRLVRRAQFLDPAQAFSQISLVFIHHQAALVCIVLSIDKCLAANFFDFTDFMRQEDNSVFFAPSAELATSNLLASRSWPKENFSFARVDVPHLSIVRMGHCIERG